MSKYFIAGLRQVISLVAGWRNDAGGRSKILIYSYQNFLNFIKAPIIMKNEIESLKKKLIETGVSIAEIEMVIGQGMNREAEIEDFMIENESIVSEIENVHMENMPVATANVNEVAVIAEKVTETHNFISSYFHSTRRQILCLNTKNQCKIGRCGMR